MCVECHVVDAAHDHGMSRHHGGLPGTPVSTLATHYPNTRPYWSALRIHSLIILKCFISGTIFGSACCPEISPRWVSTVHFIVLPSHVPWCPQTSTGWTLPLEVVSSLGLWTFIWRFPYGDFYFPEISAQSGVARFYGKCMFRFLRNCQADFQGGYTSSHSHQRWMRDLVSPHLARTWL